MASPPKFKIVIDTNVWLSGIIFGGRPGQVLQLFVDDAITVVISEELLSELRRKITQKFPGFLPYLGLLEASLRRDALLVHLGSQTVRASRDPDDNQVIETALLGNCSHIVSGDQDLLTIGSYRRIAIITPADFLTLMPATD